MARRHREKTPEGYVQSAIMEYLAAERIWHKRMNSRTVHVPDGFNGKTRPLYFGWPGMADILATPRIRRPDLTTFGRQQGLAYEDRLPVVLWIECKAPDGKQSKAQKEFQAEVEAEHHFYLLARSIDDVRNFIDRARGNANV